MPASRGEGGVWATRGLCVGSRALARQKMMHLLSAEDISCIALFREHVVSRGLRMPRMRLILFGISAFSYWAFARRRAPDASCKVSAKILKNCEPSLKHCAIWKESSRSCPGRIMSLRRLIPKGRCRKRSAISWFACRRERTSAAWKAACSPPAPSCVSCSLRSRFLFTSSFARAMCFAAASTSTLGRVASLGDASLLPRSGALKRSFAPTPESRA